MRFLSYLTFLVGTVMAAWLGFYYFFVGGLKDIISTLIISNSLVIISSENIFILGAVKVVLSGTIFLFIINLTLACANQLVQNDQ